MVPQSVLPFGVLETEFGPLDNFYDRGDRGFLTLDAIGGIVVEEARLCIVCVCGIVAFNLLGFCPLVGGIGMVGVQWV